MSYNFNLLHSKFKDGPREIVYSLFDFLESQDWGESFWPGSGWRNDGSFILDSEGNYSKGNEHPTGLAFDLMISPRVNQAPTTKQRQDAAKMLDILIKHGDELGIQWILFALDDKTTHSYNFARGTWKKLDSRGSVSADHRDHIHILFKNRAKLPEGFSWGEEIKKPPVPSYDLETTVVLNLRSQPNTSAPVLEVLPKGKVLKPTGITSGNWSKVDTTVRQGWVSSDYIKKKEEAKVTPTVDTKVTVRIASQARAGILWITTGSVTPRVTGTSVWLQRWDNTKKVWLPVKEAKTDAGGFRIESVPVIFGRVAYRVSVAQNGKYKPVVSKSTTVNVFPFPSVTAKSAGSAPINTTARVWGAVSNFAGTATVQAQVLTGGKWVTVGSKKSKGQYQIDLNFEKSKVGTTTWRVVAIYGTQQALSPTFKFTRTGQPSTAYTTAKVNVRKSASSTGPILTVANKGTKLTDLKSPVGGWSKVRLPDAREGWVSSQYVSTTAPSNKINPTDGGVITTPFGKKPNNNTYWRAFGRHTGADFSRDSSSSTRLFAVSSGTVTYRWDSVLGHIAILEADSLKGKSHRFFWYCHLAARPATGRVKAGQQIGTMGQTGTGANGPHLHLELGRSGTRWGTSWSDFADPTPYVGQG